MSYQYFYREGIVKPNIPAEDAYKELERVRKKNKGVLTPGSLVEAAKPKTHKLHTYFEWRDKVAGEHWRKQQARNLIGGVQVKVDDRNTVRAYQNVSVETQVKGGNKEGDQNIRTYTSTEEALADPVLRQQVLSRALSEAESWKRRYSDLEELSEVFAALDKVAA